MKVAIVSNSKEISVNVVNELKSELTKNKVELDQENPDLVITVGGDGTLIGGFHKYAHMVDRIRFIGVHTGHLGFYTDWRNYEIKELVKALVEQEPTSVSYPLLEVHIEEDGACTRHYLSLNESTIKRVSQTLKTDIYIKNEFFERFRGDGVCISTPTGSTAYSKSLGGAVIHPRLKTLQLTEIASINNRLFRTLSSPIIIAPDEWITLLPEHVDDYVVTIDSKEIKHHSVRKIIYQISDKQIHFAKYRHTHFWSRVEDSFLGQKKNNDTLL
ncbi:NAD kinase [Holzapfeliella sp. JNUCC 72]